MATYYVATTGNDGNAGSFGSPWLTAAHTLAPGDIVYFRGGTYNIQILPGQSGTIANRITYAAYPTETPIIRGVSATNHIISMTSTRNYLTFQGLSVSYNPAHADPPLSGGNVRSNYFNILATSTGIIVDGCTIYKSTPTGPDKTADYDNHYRELGIKIGNNANNIIVRNCDISGMNKGIQVSDTAIDIMIKNNCVHDTVQSCLSVQTSSSVMRGLLIEGNIIENSWMEDGVQTTASATGLIDSYGVIIRYNIIRGNGENGVDLKGARYCCIEYNFFYQQHGSNDGFHGTLGNNRSSLSVISVGSGDSSSDIIIRNNAVFDNSRIEITGARYKIYNNTIIYNNRDYTGTNSSFVGTNPPNFEAIHMRRNGTFINTGIKNNIAGGHHQGQLLLGFHPSAVNFDIDYNVYFAGTGGVNNFIEDTGSGFTDRTFANWQTYLSTLATVAGKDANSVLSTYGAIDWVSVPENPSGNHSGYDFKVNSGSPAYRTGTYLTTAINASGVGGANSLQVADASWFRDSYSCPYISGDPITVNGNFAIITSINYGTNTLTLDRSIVWAAGQGVYYGVTSTPDIGIDLSSYSTIIPANSVVQFTDTSSGCTALAWTWEYSLNNGGSWTIFSTSQNPIFAPSVPGLYAIRLTANCGGPNNTQTELSYLLVL